MLNILGHKALLGTAAVAIALIGALSLLPAQLSTPASANPGAVESLAGCTTGALPAGDDSNSAQAPLGFSINYFGTTFDQVFVNNNGNVTFGSALGAYTPEPISSGAGGRSIIAPFWADVDTRAGEVVHYGAASYGGRNAFCVNWVNVGYYYQHTDKINSVQLLIVDRGDVGAGDFDMYFNYDMVTWETGDASGGTNGFGGTSARMGYSNGSNVSFEYPGSAVPGAFLDGSASGLVHNQRNSLINGRYVFDVRNGQPPTGVALSGHIYRGDTQAALPGAVVAACTNVCNTVISNGDGLYQISGLAAGTYILYAYPPSGVTLMPSQGDPFPVATQDIAGKDVTLPVAVLPPPGTTLTPNRNPSQAIPWIAWNQTTALDEQDPSGIGSIPVDIVKDGVIIASITLTEGGPGSLPGTSIYSGTIPDLQPHHGLIHIIKHLPGGDIDFWVWDDPSGVVKTPGGTPIVGATVTVLRSDSSAGPFGAVPNGSFVMSPVNGRNPDMTDVNGHFGWDVIAGYYKVQAEKAGCHAPGDPGQASVETQVYTIPPPVTDIVLILDCGAEPSPTETPGTGVQIKWADADCSRNVGIGDAQKMARKLIGLSVSQTSPCPVIGGSLTVGDTVYLWADVDCSGTFTIGDAQKVSRFLIGLSVSQTDPCFGLDEVVTVQIPT